MTVYNQYNSPGMPARFWEKVNKSGDCWIWTATFSIGGRYGAIRVGDKMVSAHRLAYELERGPIPQGLELDHLCRNPHCVRPSHLEAVTHAENMRRGAQAQELRDRGYRCRHHNEVMILRSGARCCRTCRIIANREYRARKRGMA